MSLIKKIVDIVDRTDVVDAKKNINKLNKEIKDYKEKVRSIIDANYVDFMPVIISNESLLQEGSHLEHDINNLQEKLKDENIDMLQANQELSRLVAEMEEAQLGLTTSLKLVKIDSLMQKIKLYNDTQNYKEVNQLLNSIQLLIGDPDDKIIRRLEMYKNLRMRLVLERENMLRNLDKQFNKLVQMKQKTFPKARSVTLIISKNKQEIAECINSLLECDYNFESLIEFFMKNIFEPIVCRAVSMDVRENDKETTMVLSYSVEAINDDLRPNYEAVFVNFRAVLFYLTNVNVVLSNGSHFLAHIFHSEMKTIFDMIFNDCIVYNIPKTFEEKNQSTLNADITKLGNHFVELHFFESSEESKTLGAYCKKIDELFFQQFTKNVQTAADEILKRDMHDMILVSDESTLSTTTPLTFPKSMVSKSTLDLIKLLEKIIRQASTSGDEKKKNQLAAVKSVLENYTFTVQLHHQQLLSKIPQQSALFYNNCMYLCNWIALCLDLEHCDVSVVINDLKCCGDELFACQVTKQKIQLAEILKEFDPYQSLNNLMPEHFKPIRQCLRQMDLLKNVWQTILPSDFYNTTIGDLLDVISSDVIKKITSLEDISTTLSNGLVDIIKTLEEKGQSLFAADCSALDLVASWQKLQHLQFILDASLVEIQSSWKNNHISQSFKADEVKRLIRALFQNTERRANCLQNIN